MSRPMCYRCFWPQAHCWCGSITPMATRTNFVFLLHPKEFKEEKAATGRLTHLCLANSEIYSGVDFERHERVQEILRDPKNDCRLLYPGAAACNLSRQPNGFSPLPDRVLHIFILDGTWSCARKMLKMSPSLQRLPRVMFTATTESRYRIKQQPQPGCLSTLEATHELLLALAAAGLDSYPQPAQLLNLFGRMQDFQIRCAADPARPGYRRHAYQPASARIPNTASTRARRRNFLPQPATVSAG